MYGLPGERGTASGREAEGQGDSEEGQAAMSILRDLPCPQRASSLANIQLMNVLMTARGATRVVRA